MSCSILGLEESLMTIKNGGKVVLDWDSQHKRITSFGGNYVTINIEGNVITEIRGYSHIDRYYKALTH